MGTNGQVVIEESPTMLDEIDFTEVRARTLPLTTNIDVCIHIVHVTDPLLWLGRGVRTYVMSPASSSSLPHLYPYTPTSRA